MTHPMPNTSSAGSSGCSHVDRFGSHFKQCRIGGLREGTCHPPAQGYGSRRWILPDLEAKAQHYKNGVGSFPSINNKEAKHELKVKYNNKTLPFCSKPKYLGVTLDRSLTYSWNLESLRKVTLCVVLLRRLAGSGWGAE